MECIHYHINVETEPGKNTAHVTLKPPRVSDNSEAAGEPGAAVHVTSQPDLPGDFPIGQTLVRFTATDTAGNMASCSMQISVRGA